MLLPELIDRRAMVSPDKIYGFLPKSHQLEDGFSPFTYSRLAKAVNAMALWLDQVLDKTNNDWTQTVPYIGASDVRYILLLQACIKSGRSFMIPLTFNSTDGLVKLLGDCTTVLTCEGQHHHWKGAKARIPSLRIVEVPTVDFFVHESPVTDYPCRHTFQDSIGAVALKAQSSGTTGTPKVLGSTISQIQSGRGGDGRDNLAISQLFGEGCYVPSLLPMSWVAGLMFAASASLKQGNIPILLPSTAPQPMTPEYVLQVMQLAPRGARNCLLWIPSGLKQLVKIPGGLENMKHYDCIGYVGAPLDHTTGDLIAKYTRVQSFMGDTNVGPTPLVLNDPADWKIHRISPHMGHFFEKYTDDLYELCIQRQPGDHRVCFRGNPTIEVYHTRDLWKRVEGRPDYWETAGRMDDFVKLSSMTKFSAIVFEQKLESHPGVVRALVAGDARSRPFAIVELSSQDDDQSSRKVVAEALEIANRGVFKEVQLCADLVLVADAARPIRRTDKGSTERRSTIAIYAQEIEEAYKNAGLAE